ncbi:hypothetical protein [Methylocella sp. CPCC 101449]|uniref:hypothetical protein n=1 Tax=Methylocella sp. CPCC 101449 TaxID=2987531 RepID=UPI00288FDFEC|nr:hypothetical protein [Methylocella sp. CPCC 101449]MDT2022964.1 hypothetical protein [Methylocella sp. CPCC 101449]
MTQFNIALSPLVPSLVLALLALGAIIVIALSFWARRKGAWLRALGLGLILFSLADPSLVREDRDPLKDVVAVVLDRSASQSIGERTAQTDQAKEQIEKSLAALGNVETRVVEAGGGDADADGTRLFSALSSALADVPPERVGGAFIVTDGVVHDIPAHPDLLGFKAPVHALITGHEGERDRRIELVEAPRFGLVGKDQTITARILDSADRGEPVELVVRRDGAEISRQRVRTGATVRVNVRVEHGGPNVVELEVAALDDELTALNNKAVVLIEGVRDKLKVLLVSGEPHAGERTWRNLLKSDANVDLVHFTILRPPEKSGLDGTPISELSLIAFPTADLFGRKIREFDLIIFDRYSNQTVLPPVYFENIVRFVREGGALLIAAGPDYSGRDGLFFSPLGKIAPARPSGDVIEKAFRAQITTMGNRHPVTRGLPGADQTPPAWSEWFRQVDAEPLRGTPVMSGIDNKPLLLLSREEKGRVGLLLSDQIWLWARNYQNGGPHLELLRRLAHWLMKEPELEEEALRATARGREISIERQSLKDAIDPVTVTSPSGNSQIVSLKEADPGISRAQVRVSEPGLYRLTDGELTALVNVGAENPVEFREVVSTLDKLRPLVEATGGTVRRISAGSGDAISLPRFTAMRDSPLYGGSDYVAIRRTGASVVTGIGVAPLAIGFLGLLALLGSVLVGWLWESRRRGEA